MFWPSARCRLLTVALGIRPILVASGAGLCSAITTLAADEFRLINLSARAQVGSGDVALIGGFVVGPGSDATVLIRAIGPTLATEPFSISGASTDPTLTLFGSDTGRILAENDDWNAMDASVFSAVGAFSLGPGSKDAALVVTLKPGSYTVHAAEKGTGAAGELALLEIYEVDRSAARLLNLSLRGRVGTRSGIVIIGFIVAGGGEAEGVLIRASGTALRQFGLANVIENPVLTITRPDNSIAASNDDWSSAIGQGMSAAGLASIFRRTGAFDFEPGSRDPAVFVRSASGAYTAQVRGASDATGVALVEVYLASAMPTPERFSAGFFNEGELRSDGRWVNVQHWGYYARGRTLFWFSPQANVGAAILTNGTENDQALGMRPISETVIELFRRYRSTPPSATAAQSGAR